ncbi:MAG: type II toxin-antitoxin system prevent-host-death family antitoxin [Deltaproteobacteria bacterium]|nr:type II toxin-antitoxin system prevent-host-death family antitoxin [Deltaproteobacteria bacterium]
MDTVSYTRARESLAKTMDRVVENHEPIIITRQKGQAVVMMSLEDFNAYEETAYLLRNPANAARLLKALDEARQGKHTPRELSDAP